MLKRDALTALVRKAQTMDPDAMNALFEACRDPIYYFSLKTLQDPDAAEDVAQEAMIDIFRNLEKLQDPVAFQAWSREITYRQCLRYMKKTPDILVNEDEEGYSVFDTLEEENEAFIPDAAMENKEFQKTVQDMVNSLPAEQRAAILLYHFDGLSVKEIAQIQQVPENTVKSRLMYGRRAIKLSVESYEKKHGIKLHSFAIAPFLAWLFAKDMLLCAMPAAGAAAAATGVATATGVAVSAGTKTAGGVVTAAAAKASVPVAAKVAAGIAAVGVAAGGVAIATGFFEDKGFDSPQYESAYMEIYGESHRFQQEFKAIHGSGETALYIQTEDGQLFALSDPETDMLDGCQVEKVISADNTVGYMDKAGTTYIWHEGAYRAFPGLKGKVVYSRGSGSLQVLTLDGKQMYSSVYDVEKDELETLNETFTVMEGFEKVDKVHYSTAFNFLDHQTCYYAASGDQQMLGAFTEWMPLDHHKHTPYTVDGTPVTVTYLAGRYDATVGSPLFAVEGDKEHVYYSGFYGEDLDVKVALPKGKTVYDIRQALFSQQIYLLFQDGSVYAYRQYGEGFEKLDHLSGLGKDGHIQKLYLSGEEEHYTLLCLMDDDVLYRYEADPALPEPADTDSAPSKKEDGPDVENILKT